MHQVDLVIADNGAYGVRTSEKTNDEVAQHSTAHDDGNYIYFIFSGSTYHRWLRVLILQENQVT